MRSVLITGAAGGLGSAAVRRFADAGWQVYAADIAPASGWESGAVTPLVMDVTSSASVADALRGIEGLDAVVTMAGVLAIGALTDLSDERLARVLDINVMGTHRVVRASFPLVRAAGGRVVLFSSETGRQRALPLNGAYAVSKHAIEAYGDALRRELSLLGLAVTIIEPGPFRTSMTGSIGAGFESAAPEGSPYARLARRMGRVAAKEHDKAHDPAILAEAVFAAVTAARPPARVYLKPDPMRRALDLLPVPVVDALLRRTLRL